MTSARRKTLALYRGLGLRSRLHVLVRWATCPFPAVAAAVPSAGRVLEVGCGHGLFSAYLALSSPARVVHGVDLDADKIHGARSAAERAQAHGAQLTFDVAPSGAVPPGPWAAVAIIDVLYLLGRDEQLDLVTRCAEQLAPDGVLLVKEMDDKPRWKARFNVLQETLAVQILNITEGHDLTLLPPSDLAAPMRQAGLTVSGQAIHHGRPHPHYLLIGRRPAGGEDAEPPSPADVAAR